MNGCQCTTQPHVGKCGARRLGDSDRCVYCLERHPGPSMENVAAAVRGATQIEAWTEEIWQDRDQ